MPWSRLFNKGDAAALAGMYTDDAYLMPPQADLVRGRDGIQQVWKGASGQVGDMKLTTVDVKPFGTDAAREIGTFRSRPRASNSRRSSGSMSCSGRRSGPIGSSRPIWRSFTRKEGLQPLLKFTGAENEPWEAPAVRACP